MAVLESQSKIDDLCVNTIRTLAMDAVQKANSGHPGAPMGLAAAAYALWTDALKHNPENPEWCDRDRFILSCGHASTLLYSLLYLTGYELELDDLKNFLTGIEDESARNVIFGTVWEESSVDPDINHTETELLDCLRNAWQIAEQE